MRKKAIRRRLEGVLGPIIFCGIGGWLLLDNGPALVDALRLGPGGRTGTATVLSVGGGRPQRAIRRWADDLLWGRGRRVTYRLDSSLATTDAYSASVMHWSAESLRESKSIRVRYLASNPAVHRVEGQPGPPILSFRLAIGMAAAVLGLRWFWSEFRPARRVGVRERTSS